MGVQKDQKAHHVESVQKEKEVHHVAEDIEDPVRMQMLVILTWIWMRRMWTVIWMAHFQQSKVVARKLRSHVQKEKEEKNVVKFEQNTVRMQMLLISMTLRMRKMW